MRILLAAAFALLFAGGLAAQTVWTVETLPDPKSGGATGYVADPDSILTAADRDRLNQRIASLESATTAQVAVVIVRSIGDETPKTFATNLFNHWGIGGRNNNGLLIFTALDQRRTESETGYGMEATLPDALLARLQEDYMVPRFRAGEFGAGLLALVEQIDRLLRDPKAAAELREETKPSVFDEDDSMIGYGVLMGAYLIALLLLGVESPKRKPPKDGGPHYPPAPRKLTPLGWLLLLWGPLLLVGNWLAGGPLFAPYAFWPFAGVAWLSLALMLLHIRLRSNSLALQAWTDPYHTYQHLRHVNQFLWVNALLFPPVFLPFWIVFRLRQRKLRYQPRVSLHSGEPLTLLSEAEEDAYLSQGKQMEEELRTVDHDVWIDSSGEEVLVLPYKRFQLTYKVCPKCSFITCKQTGTRTLTEATYTSSGTGARDFACKNCGHKHMETYTIPKKERSSSSSGSSGSSSWSSGGGGSSSSGSSSWGGGSSGGGGAGSSW